MTRSIALFLMFGTSVHAATIGGLSNWELNTAHEVIKNNDVDFLAQLHYFANHPGDHGARWLLLQSAATPKSHSEAQIQASAKFLDAISAQFPLGGIVPFISEYAASITDLQQFDGSDDNWGRLPIDRVLEILHDAKSKLDSTGAWNAVDDTTKARYGFVHDGDLLPDLQLRPQNDGILNTQSDSLEDLRRKLVQLSKRVADFEQEDSPSQVAPPITSRVPGGQERVDHPMTTYEQNLRWSADMETADQTVGILAFVAKQVGRESAYNEIRALGNASLQVAKAVHEFRAIQAAASKDAVHAAELVTSGKLMMCVNVAGAALAIVSVIGDIEQRDDTHQQLQAIIQMLREVEDQVQKLDRKIDAINDLLVKNFENLNLILNDVLERSGELDQHVIQVQKLIIDTQREIHTEVKSLLQHERNQALAGCFPEVTYVKPPDRETNFRRCDDALRSNLSDAFSANYTDQLGNFDVQGGIFRLAGYETFTMSDLRVMMTDGLNFLAGLAATRYGVQGLPEVEPNPAILANDIRLFTDYEIKHFAQHPTLPGDGEVSGLITSAGLLGMFFDLTVANENFQARLADDIVNDYDEILNIQSKIWESLPDIATKEVGFGKSAIHVCPNERNYGDIAPPVDFDKLVPNEVYIAAMLGLGELDACYLVRLYKTTEVDKGKTLDDVGIQIKVTLNTASTEPLIVSQRELIGPRVMRDNEDVYDEGCPFLFCRMSMVLKNEDLIQGIWQGKDFQTGVAFHSRHHCCAVKLSEQFAAKSVPLITLSNVGQTPNQVVQADVKELQREIDLALPKWNMVDPTLPITDKLYKLDLISGKYPYLKNLLQELINKYTVSRENIAIAQAYANVSDYYGASVFMCEKVLSSLATGGFKSLVLDGFTMKHESSEESLRSLLYRSDNRKPVCLADRRQLRDLSVAIESLHVLTTLQKAAEKYSQD